MKIKKQCYEVSTYIYESVKRLILDTKMKSEKVFETSADMNVTQFKSSPNLSPEMSQGLSSANSSGKKFFLNF